MAKKKRKKFTRDELESLTIDYSLEVDSRHFGDSLPEDVYDQFQCDQCQQTKFFVYLPCFLEWVDLVCSNCGSRLNIMATIADPHATEDEDEKEPEKPTA